MDLRPGPGSPPVALYVTAWAPALANLRQLSLGTGHRLLRLVTSLGGVSALRRMSISGRVEIDPAVRLPPNLEFLAYRDCVGSTLPQQASRHGNMDAGPTLPWKDGEVCIDDISAYAAVAFTPADWTLQQFDHSQPRFGTSARRRLHHPPPPFQAATPAVGRLPIPANLPVPADCTGRTGERPVSQPEVVDVRLMSCMRTAWQLIGVHCECCNWGHWGCFSVQALTRAGFDKGEPELATATLDRALRHLQQLTSLSIVEISGIDISVLDTVAGLSRLQRCSLIQRWSSEDGGLHALPDGPWHDSLRCLAADWELLHPSADVLANFTHLEHVWAMIARYYSCADGADFWRWARTHPSLQKRLCELTQ